MGLAPGLVPGRTALADASATLRDEWPLLPSGRGLDAGGILTAAADGRIGCLVLLGVDPVADFPDRDLARRALAGAGTVIALDAFLTDSSREADIVLAVSAFGEKDGTTTNFEGRVSPLAQKVTPPGTAIEDWMIAVELADRLGRDLGVESEASIRAEVAAVSSIHEQLAGAPPDGVVVSGAGTTFPIEDSGGEPPAPKSYDFRLLVDRDLYDAAVFTARSPALAELPRGARVDLNPGDADRRGFADGAPVRLIAPRTSIVLAARADERVPRGVARIAYNQPGGAVNEILDVSLPVTDVRIEAP
jgi:predicted molibdopterin-dependent oxidoreductase YjgC